MGVRENLNNNIKEVLRSIDVLDANVIYDYPTFNSYGSPFVFFVPSSADSEFSTQSSNQRTYGFTIALVSTIDENSIDVSYTELRSLEDKVLDTFDADYTLGEVVMPANYHLIDTFAAPSSWIRVDKADRGQFLVAEVELRILVEKDI